MKNSRRLSFSVIFAAALAAIASVGNAATTYTPATPGPGADIPTVPVKFGMRPYADNTYFVIGMEKGWFKDVGIEITPAPYGLKTTEAQWVSLLLNHSSRHQLGYLLRAVALLQDDRSAEVRWLRRDLLRRGDACQPEARVEAADRLHDSWRDPQRRIGQSARAFGWKEGLRARLDLGKGLCGTPLQVGRARFPRLRHDGGSANAPAREVGPH